MNPLLRIAAAFLLLGFFEVEAASQRGDAAHLAVLADGTRIEGKDLSKWGDTAGKPKLAGRDLFDPANPVRWLRSGTVPGGPPPRAFVEFAGGDRLPGTVVGFRPAADSPTSSLPPHLVVEPDPALDFPDGPPRPRLRVLLRPARRIVWEARGPGALRPGTVFYRDGRETSFRSIRFAGTSIRLLLEDGTAEAPFGQVAEIHLPRLDPWESYIEEVAVLSPAGEGLLSRIGTETGLVATSSLERFSARPHGDAGDPARWYHLVAPAWSIDPLWVPHRTVRERSYWRPHEVPASRIEPIRIRQESALGSSWRLRTDRSVMGGTLESGGLPYGWGFGVHALCDIELDLPPSARAFRSLFGLDAAAGGGGSARAVVLPGRPGAAPLFRSEVLTGSSRVGDTGLLPIEPGPGGRTRIVLRADPCLTDRPQGSDPLDIRDHLDWLEPEIRLDPAALAADTEGIASSIVPAWRDWTIEGPPAAARLSNRLDTSDGARPGFRLEALPGYRYLKLSRRLRVDPGRNWLLVGATRWSGSGAAAHIIVRVDRQAAAEFDAPERGAGWAPDPVLIPLRKHRGREVPIEVFQLAGAGRAPVDWSVLEIAELPPGVLRIFEDDPRQAQLRWRRYPEFAAGLDPAPPQEAEVPVEAGKEAKVEASLARQGARSGSACLLLPRGGEASSQAISAAISEWPRQGEYRFLRYAWKKPGGGTVRLEVSGSRPRGESVSVRFQAGGPEEEGIVRVDEKPPLEWTVVVRDLFKDRGAFVIEGLAFGSPAGEEVLFDGIYLARSKEDLDRIDEGPSGPAGK